MSDDIPEAASRMFQITEEDLAAIEKLLPDLMHAHAAQQYEWEKDKWRTVIEIVKNVRWCYGPWLECHELPAAPDEPKQEDDADWWKKGDDTEIE